MSTYFPFTRVVSVETYIDYDGKKEQTYFISAIITVIISIFKLLNELIMRLLFEKEEKKDRSIDGIHLKDHHLDA